MDGQYVDLYRRVVEHGRAADALLIAARERSVYEQLLLERDEAETPARRAAVQAELDAFTTVPVPVSTEVLVEHHTRKVALCLELVAIGTPDAREALAAAERELADLDRTT